jgi:hypothetical protein
MFETSIDRFVKACATLFDICATSWLNARHCINYVHYITCICR